MPRTIVVPLPLPLRYLDCRFLEHQLLSDSALRPVRALKRTFRSGFWAKRPPKAGSQCIGPASCNSSAPAPSCQRPISGLRVEARAHGEPGNHAAMDRMTRSIIMRNTSTMQLILKDCYTITTSHITTKYSPVLSAVHLLSTTFRARNSCTTTLGSV